MNGVDMCPECGQTTLRQDRIIYYVVELDENGEPERNYDKFIDGSWEPSICPECAEEAIEVTVDGLTPEELDSFVNAEDEKERLILYRKYVEEGKIPAEEEIQVKP